MTMETLEFLWYLVFLIVLMGYVCLDGFDLGVGILHPFAKGDHERRIFLNAIGPVWDGNEVWLVILGGSLFAGFPHVYATLLSAFYIPVMVFLAGLIFRAVAIEFRSKQESHAWRRFWDWIFALGSLVIAVGLGFVLGNLIQGIPLDRNHEFTGDLATLISPYSILTAIFMVALMAMHGAIYLVMKTEGELHDKMRHWTNRCIGFFIFMYIVVTIVTLLYLPHMGDRFRAVPWLFVIPGVSILAIANVPRQMSRGNDGWAFLSSCLAIILFVGLYSIGLFPELVRATDPALSLTIRNSYASKKTLQVLLIIVAIGIPIALAYLISIYYLFRGKVKIDPHSY